MILIYKRDNWKHKLNHIITLDAFDELCEWLYYIPYNRTISNYFGYSDTETTKTYNISMFGNYIDGGGSSDYEITKCFKYVVYENDILVTPDRLLGIYRQYKHQKYKSRTYYNRGKNRPASSGKTYRRVKIRNEVRQAFDTYNKEYDITVKVRGKRSSRSLRNECAELKFNIQRSWKIQSKRKRQWK